MGKAIISEELRYEVSGEFAVGKNYLSFSNADECINAVQRLVNDLEYTYQMKLNNLVYYCQYLRPDRIIKRMIDIIDEQGR